MIVYSNSCSFGAKQSYATYGEILAQNLDAEFINAGRFSSCNRRIIRCTVRDILKLRQNFDDLVLVLVGLTFISRTELWQPDLPAVDNDGHFHPITIDDSAINWTQGLINTFVPDVHQYAREPLQQYYRHWLLHMHKESLITELATDVVMLTDFCQHNNIQLLLWSNTQVWPGPPEVARDDVFLQDLSAKIMASTNILNPWTFCFKQFALDLGLVPFDYDRYGDDGHPGETAHQRFAEFLLNEIQRQKSK